MADDVAATGACGTGAVLCANADEIWLNGNRGNFHLPRCDIVKIGRDGMYPWFFRGLRIRHRVARLPKNLQFIPKAGKTRDVIAQLKALGFPTA